MQRVNASFTAMLEFPYKETDVKLGNAIKSAQKVLDAAVQRSMWPFTPYLTGAMQTSLRGIGTGKLTYGVVYDRRNYYGSEDWNWTRMHHAQAGPKWFERAKELDADKWQVETQNALDRYMSREGSR